MTSRDDDPTGWKALEQLIGSASDRAKRRWWGEIGEELEVQVSSRGVVLSKGYRLHGASLEHPWLEVTSDELRGLLARGEEILRAIDQAAAEASGDRSSDEQGEALR